MDATIYEFPTGRIINQHRDSSITVLQAMEQLRALIADAHYVIRSPRAAHDLVTADILIDAIEDALA